MFFPDQVYAPNLDEFEIRPSLPKDVPIYTDHVEFERQLRPGDILNTLRLKKAGPLKTLWFGIKQFINQHPFTHSAMYAGKSKIIHTDIAPASIKRAPLSSLTSTGLILAMRVRTDPAKKRMAVAFMNRSVGYSVGDIRMQIHIGYVGLRHAIHDMVMGGGRGPHTGKEKAPQLPPNVFCSNVIAVAYSGVVFTSKIPRRYITPVDFYRSRMTEKIALFVPKSMVGTHLGDEQRKRIVDQGVAK